MFDEFLGGRQTIGTSGLTIENFGQIILCQ